MSKKIIIVITLIPILLLVEVTSITGIFSLISTPSDIAVLVGVLFTGIFFVGNYYLVKYIINVFKNN